MTNEVTTRSVSIKFFFLMVVLGLLGNIFSPTLFFGIDYLFGSVFTMLALRFLGWKVGALTGLIISSYTFYLWGHPYAIVSFFLEALVVGFLVYKTKIKDYVIADILFWLFVGFPVVFFCYKNVLSLETSVVQIIALKQTVNGVVNTVISVLLYIALLNYKHYSLLLQALCANKHWQLSQLLRTLLIIFPLIPLMVVLIAINKSNYESILKEEREYISQTGNYVEAHLSSSINNHINEAKYLAKLYFDSGQEETKNRNELLREVNAITPVVVAGNAENGVEKYLFHSDNTLEMIQDEVLKKLFSEPENKLSFSVDGKFFYSLVDMDERSRRVLTIYPVEAIHEIVNEALSHHNAEVDILFLSPDAKVISLGGLSKLSDIHETHSIDETGLFLEPNLQEDLSKIGSWNQSYLFVDLKFINLTDLTFRLLQPTVELTSKVQQSYGDTLLFTLVIILLLVLMAKLVSNKFETYLAAWSQMLNTLTIDKTHSSVIKFGHEPSDLTPLLVSFAHLLSIINEEKKKLLALNGDYKKAARQSLNNELYITEVLDNINDGIVVSDVNGVIKSVNQKISTIFGYSMEELVGTPSSTLSAHAYKDAHNNGIKRYNKTQKSKFVNHGSVEAQGLTKLGKTLDIDISVSKLVLQNEVNFIAVIRDISLKKEYESQLHQANRRMAQFLAASTDAILFYDNYKVVDFNDIAIELFGYSKAQIIGKDIFELVNLEDPATLSTYIEAGEETSIECRCLNNSGRPFPVELIAKTITFENKLKQLLIVKDISIKKANEAKYNAVRKENELLIEKANNPIFSVNTQGDIIQWNRSVEDLTGWNKKEITGINISSIINLEPELASNFEHFLQKVRNTKYELRLKSKTNRELTILVSVVSVDEQNNQTVIFIGQDITEIDDYRKKSKLAAKQKESQLNTIFNLSPDAYVVINDVSQIVFANPAFTRLTGYDGKQYTDIDLVGFKQLLVQNCIENKAQLLNIKDNEEVTDLRFSINHPQPVTLSLTSKLIKNKNATFGSVWFLRDVTHETKVDKMKSEFLSTAAHELRTPLASILGFSDLLLRNKYDEVEQDELLNIINRQSLNLRTLLNELLDLAKIEANNTDFYSMNKVDIKDVVTSVSTDMSILAKEKQITLNHNIEVKKPAYIYGDKEKLGQAITNVVSNAIKYSDNGTTVNILLTVGRSESCVAVRDEGIGMTKEEMARVGERFYRAEKSGNIPGTGLGMTIVKEIIARHKGSIDIDSSYGEGSTIKICLPTFSNSILIKEEGGK